MLCRPERFGAVGSLGFVTSGLLPPKFSGLTAWYRYNSGITVTGSGVSQWDDQSGNGNHLLQGTDTNRPLPGSLGSEATTDGDMSSSANWTEQAGHNITGGELVLTSAADDTKTFQTSAETLTAGKSYLVTYTISGYSAGGAFIRLANNIATTIKSADGTFSEIVTIATASDQLIRIIASGTTTLNIDDVSIKEIDFTAGLLFDGVDNFLKANAFTLNQPTTVYILGKQITWTLNDTLFDGDTTNTGRLYQKTATPQLTIIADNSALTPLDTTDLLIDTYGVVNVVVDGVNSSIQVNNNAAVTGSLGTNNMGGFTLGALGSPSFYSHIQVKEVIIYNVAHNATQRASIINYLNSL